LGVGKSLIRYIISLYIEVNPWLSSFTGERPVDLAMRASFDLGSNREGRANPRAP
jgi:hypothetical protein